MTAAASRPDPAGDESGHQATAPVWRVVVNMPVFGAGKKIGQPVGWQSMNKLPKSAGESIWWNKAKKQWRLASYAALVKARVPQRLGRIKVEIELRFTEVRKQRNSENVGHSIKPVIDALGKQTEYVTTYRGRPKVVIAVGRHVVEGDDERFMIQTHPKIGEPLGRNSKIRGQIILTIRQIPQETT